MTFRMTHSTALVVAAVAAGHRYGFDVMDATGLASGTIYPILRRLEEAGVLASRWEDEERARTEGRPRRKLYEIRGEAGETVAEARRRLARGRGLLPDRVEPGEEGVR